MSNHAPGPWYVGEKRLGYDIVIRSEPENDPICTVVYAGFSRPEAEANARLIAAAPEMLVAAVMGLEAIDAMLSSHEGQAEYAQLKAAFIALEISIANAEGRT